MDGFFAIVAPAGTPAEVVARLNREIGQYLKGSDIQERLLSLGLATEGAGTPESSGANHPTGAGGVARAGKGTGRRAAVTML